MDRRLKNPKGSHVYRKQASGIYTTLKGSNVYRLNNDVFHSTPTGSHSSLVTFFYIHQIPSGLVVSKKSKTIEANIQKGLAELKELM